MKEETLCQKAPGKEKFSVGETFVRWKIIMKEVILLKEKMLKEENIDKEGIL